MYRLYTANKIIRWVLNDLTKEFFIKKCSVSIDKLYTSTTNLYTFIKNDYMKLFYCCKLA